MKSLVSKIVMKFLIATSLILILIDSTFALYTIIRSKPNNVTFKYMDGINGESDLHECEFNEVCNIVHNRFWTSSLTERLCLCSNKRECSWQWTSLAESSSIQLNNRSVMKFCTAVTEMDQCAYKKDAAVVHAKGDKNNSYLIPYNVTVNCKCPASHYWRLQKYTYENNDTVIQTFKCAKKRMCESREFCGHVRADLYSVYYKCTCPQNHLCIFRDKTQENVQELLYSGPAYKAYCYMMETV